MCVCVCVCVRVRVCVRVFVDIQLHVLNINYLICVDCGDVFGIVLVVLKNDCIYVHIYYSVYML